MVSQYKTWKGLSGGAKKLWLENHRDEVYAYWKSHGDTKTRVAYGLQQTTLDNFLIGMGESRGPLTDTDKIMMRLEYVEGRVRSHEHRLDIQDKNYSQFVELVSGQVAKIYEQNLNMMLRSVIQIPENLEVKNTSDALCLDENLGGEAKK